MTRARIKFRGRPWPTPPVTAPTPTPAGRPVAPCVAVLARWRCPVCRRPLRLTVTSGGPRPVVAFACPAHPVGTGD